jgi:hypothetical protein
MLPPLNVMKAIGTMMLIENRQNSFVLPVWLILRLICDDLQNIILKRKTPDDHFYVIFRWCQIESNTT